MAIEGREGVTSIGAPCVARNTRPHAWVRAIAALPLLLAGLVWFSGYVSATETATDSVVVLDAKVVWVTADRAVLASSDSIAVEEYDALEFLDRKKPVATGVVARIYEPGMLAARITSGSLHGKKLDHIRVFASHPVAPTPRLLRVGYPSARRANLLFRCTRTAFHVPSGYRADATNLQRFLRDGAADPPWPDTLSIQAFDESGDEEIAFERGELDIAVFWPGELSASERARLDERNHILTPRATGVLAATFVPSASRSASGIVLADSTGLESMNRDLFGGDLAMIRSYAGLLSPSVSRDGTAKHPVRVDHACPGWQVLERALNKPPQPIAGSSATGSIRVAYYDRSPADAPSDSATAWLFRVRCPVLFIPSLRRVLERWHGESVVDLFACEPSEGVR